MKHHTANKISLCRYGGIGKFIKQKGNFEGSIDSEEMSFHQAPERKGYYAFIFPYVELFLLGSPVNKSGKDHNGNTNHRGRFMEKESKMYKKFFASSGTIWTHLKPKNRHMLLEQKGCWYKINVSDFHIVLKGHIGELTKELKGSGYKSVKNPYKFYSKDDMEVFITAETKINS
jgi:hypothetical protein